MPLFIVATPIGNPLDFTLRALETLKAADLIIGEELKVLRQTLKAAGVSGKTLDQLNEHSREVDFKHFVEECKVKRVALVSDCGTPGFCDPGAELVAACAQAGVKVHAVPGPSSLMALLSVSGVRLSEFVFSGFLPTKAGPRAKALAELRRERRPCVVMETPYRCERLVDDLARELGGRRCVLGLNLTQENERVIRALGRDLPAHGPYENAEPVVLILPGDNGPCREQKSKS
ncbi:MAG: SAM-dependent methyltransferase [Bdellovibrionales bacterium]